VNKYSGSKLQNTEKVQNISSCILAASLGLLGILTCDK